MVAVGGRIVNAMATVAARLQRTSRSQLTDWRRFWIACALTFTVIAGVIAFVGFRLAGPGVGGWFDEIAQGVAAFAAGGSCLLLSRRTAGKVRTAWGLIGMSTLVTALVGVAVFVIGTWVSPGIRFPSVADGFYLAGQLVALAGIMSFPSSPARASSRTRLAIDGLVIAISLLYVSWAFGLGNLYASAHVQVLGATVALAYPVTDIVSITVFLLVIRRANRVKYGRLGLLLAGLVFKLVADTGYALTFAFTGLEQNVAGPDIAWITGFALIALAAWTPAGSSTSAPVETPSTLWRMVMPWLGLVAVVASSVTLIAMHRPIDPFVIYPGVALVGLLMFSQLVSYRETLTFLHLSKNAEGALQVRTNLLNQVILHAPLGVARVGLDNRIIDANPRLGELLHASTAVLVGAQVSEFVIREDAADAIEDRYRALMRGELDMVEEEGSVRRSDGTAAWLHWTTTAVRRADGRVEYFLTMIEDMSARHDAEETAMENLAGLERLNKLKSEFVSMVSHEFRTALVGIQGFSELIRDDELEIPDIKGLAGDINNDAQRLNRMIGEMLDLDRMEAGKIRLELKPLNLNALLEDAVERARVSTETHQVDGDLDLALPVVTGDNDRIVQVVSNLLSNAVKYSPQGGRIRLTSRFEGDAVHISVSDEGPGIPNEFLGRVFGRYERFESNHASKVTGTGLGLAISRQIVELHGGRIWVESEVGKGSTFHFTIPVAPKGAAAPAS